MPSRAFVSAHLSHHGVGAGGCLPWSLGHQSPLNGQLGVGHRVRLWGRPAAATSADSSLPAPCPHSRTQEHPTPAVQAQQGC